MDQTVEIIIKEFDKYVNPFVSIIVITYNSAKYVVETLDSAKEQTYCNIELIVSDDCSTDNTVDICRKWIAANRNRFIRTELISSPSNTGIASNCNRGYKAARGEWLKGVAGDDILSNTCICDNLEYVTKNKNVTVVFSDVLPFADNDRRRNWGIYTPDTLKIWFNSDAKSQYNRLLESNFNWSTPSFFINRLKLAEVGYFDERFPFIEDYPLWLKFTQNGIALNYFERITVFYRQSFSITRASKKWINRNYYKSIRNHFLSEVREPLYLQNKKLCRAKMFYIFKMNILIHLFNNKVTLPSRVFNKYFELFLRPAKL